MECKGTFSQVGVMWDVWESNMSKKVISQSMSEVVLELHLPVK